jgi:heterotetrameric sarcosine oxidase gamma subunit
MGYDVQIRQLETNAVIDLQGPAPALKKWLKTGLPSFPELPNSASTSDGLSLYWIAPERWLLRSVIDNEDRMLEMTQPASAPIDISVVLVSDTLRFFEIVGPDAGEIISTASSMDHHLSVFPQNGVSYTNIFGIKGLLIRIEEGFEIAVESSFADMIGDYLARATG